MTRPVGIYVHHQGAGHWQRARLIGSALDRPCALLGTFDAIDTSMALGVTVDLPDDRLGAGFDGADCETERPESLHYAPLNHPGIRARMARIAAWIAQADPILMIVDVSVEVALLCRLLSVPVLFVRLAGARTDRPHLEAFRSAARLIAPFPEALDATDVPDLVRTKTLYAGFLAAPPMAEASPAEDGRIVVVLGRGGAAADRARLVEAARAVPERDWHVLGLVETAQTGSVLPPNLHLHGWVERVAPHLARAALIVGGAGDGVLAAASAAARPFICLPEPRPYGEQVAKADALAALGAAVVRPDWPRGEEWPDIVRQALALDPTIIGGLYDAEAIPRLAAEIETIAREIEAR